MTCSHWGAQPQALLRLNQFVQFNIEQEGGSAEPLAGAASLMMPWACTTSSKAYV